MQLEYLKKEDNLQIDEKLWGGAISIFMEGRLFANRRQTVGRCNREYLTKGDNLKTTKKFM